MTKRSPRADELLAQPAGVAVERPRRAQRPEPPDVPQQLRLREHPRRLGRELAQQRELLLRQRDARAAHANLACHRVDAPARPRAAAPPRAAHATAATARRRAGAALRMRTAWRRSRRRRARSRAPGRSHPPAPTPRAAADGIDARAGAARLAHPAQQLEPRPVGQPDVDDREVDVVVLQRAQRVAQRGGDEQVVAVGGQVVGKERPRRDVILDDQDARGLGHARP